ncbi:unnamed protein product, partial [Mesorhabditis belari]|uniref:Uncharacterized protein n=1 Tax=Mesorhabditis belari TaxID=2138241 RepID=A0AAF3EA92_9BILA
MNSPNHLPSASPVPVSPSNQPPSPMEDQSPPRSPKMVQSKDGAIRGGAIRDGVSRDGAIRDGAIPSANDPMDPPSKIPNNHKDLDNVAEKLMNLVLDDQIHQLNSPASPLPSFEPTKVSESISTNVHLDTPIIDEDTRSIDPVKKENVEVVADDCDDEFIDDQEPIYSHLSSFYSRDFHEISPNSHGNANIDVNPQHSFINENTSPFEDDSIFAYVGLPPLRTIHRCELSTFIHQRKYSTTGI